MNTPTSNSLEPILKVKALSKSFPILKGILRREVGRIHAVTDVSFDVLPQETIGIVGESGCGKSTLAKTIIRLYDPSAGAVEIMGRDLSQLRARELRGIRKNIQMIFQDPLDSLNPRMTILDILSEPYKIHGIKLSYSELKTRIKALLAKVGLPDISLSRYPHEFSGGQCQRIGIARALTLNPKLIVCDEPVSALDVSVQSQVINLLLSLQQELKLSYIFISHDLTVVRHISDKVIVMYLGEMVEFTDSLSLYTEPLHPYTKALLATIPSISQRTTAPQVITGEIPSPMNPPSGCKFHTRCDFAQAYCKTNKPELRQISPTQTEPKTATTPHYVACHFAEDIIKNSTTT